MNGQKGPKYATGKTNFKTAECSISANGDENKHRESFLNSMSNAEEHPFTNQNSTETPINNSSNEVYYDNSTNLKKSDVKNAELCISSNVKSLESFKILHAIDERYTNVNTVFEKKVIINPRDIKLTELDSESKNTNNQCTKSRPESPNNLKIKTLSSDQGFKNSLDGANTENNKALGNYYNETLVDKFKNSNTNNSNKIQQTNNSPINSKDKNQNLSRFRNLETDFPNIHSTNCTVTNPFETNDLSVVQTQHVNNSNVSELDISQHNINGDNNINPNSPITKKTFAETLRSKNVASIQSNIIPKQDSSSLLSIIDFETEEASQTINSLINTISYNEEDFQIIQNKFNNSIPENLLKSFINYTNDKTLILTTTDENTNFFKFPVEKFSNLIAEKQIVMGINRIFYHPNDRYIIVEFKTWGDRNSFKNTIRMLDGRYLITIDTNRPTILHGTIRNCIMNFEHSDLQITLTNYGKIGKFQFWHDLNHLPTNIASFTITLKDGIKSTDIPTVIHSRGSPMVLSFRGVPPQCFHCSERTHLVKDCTARICNACGIKKNKYHRCIKNTTDSVKINSKGYNVNLIQLDSFHTDALIPSHTQHNTETFQKLKLSKTTQPSSEPDKTTISSYSQSTQNLKPIPITSTNTTPMPKPHNSSKNSETIILNTAAHSPHTEQKETTTDKMNTTTTSQLDESNDDSEMDSDETIKNHPISICPYSNKAQLQIQEKPQKRKRRKKKKPSSSGPSSDDETLNKAGNNPKQSQDPISLNDNSNKRRKGGTTALNSESLPPNMKLHSSMNCHQNQMEAIHTNSIHREEEVMLQEPISLSQSDESSVDWSLSPGET